LGLAAFFDGRWSDYSRNAAAILGAEDLI